VPEALPLPPVPATLPLPPVLRSSEALPPHAPAPSNAAAIKGAIMHTCFRLIAGLERELTMAALTHALVRRNEVVKRRSTADAKDAKLGGSEIQFVAA
jgi:hypothetical protein